MSLTGREMQAVGRVRDLGEFCCGTCHAIQSVRVIEDEGWGHHLDTERGYCADRDLEVPFTHEACDGWDVR